MLVIFYFKRKVGKLNRNRCWGKFYIDMFPQTITFIKHLSFPSKQANDTEAV